MVFTFSVLGQKYPFFGKLGPKNQHCSFKVIRFRPETPFLANLIQEIKIACLSWKLVLRLIPIWSIQWWCSLFVFFIFLFSKYLPCSFSCSRLKMSNVPPIIILKTDSTTKVSCEVFEKFYNCWKASVVKSLLSKETE